MDEDGFVLLAVVLLISFAIAWKFINDKKLALKRTLASQFRKDYEQRKLTIGTIKCSQCEWSGQWGTGMRWTQFFAGNLAEHGIKVRGPDDHLSRDNRQYTCPVCNSSDWKKV